MKKSLIPVIGLILALAVAGIVSGFTLSAGSGSSTEDAIGENTHGDPTNDELSDLGDGKVVTSIDDIDPNVCNMVHNINACTPEELEELGIGPTHGDPTYDEWLSDHGDGKVVTSIDDIDPNVCDYIHNINACTPEELEELGNLAAISWMVDPDTVVEGEPEPPFVDGEPMYEVQSYEEAVEQDCDLAGGTLNVSSDGEIWCVFVHDIEDGGEGETQAQPPVVAPETEPLPTK